jgi:hypothetical protein
VLLVILLIPGAAGFYYFGYNVGTLTVSVTDDALSDFQSLNITFGEITVHTTSALTTNPWVTLKIAESTVDLTKLTNNLSDIVGLSKIPAGKYTQLRILVVSSEGVLHSGERVLVRAPSGELNTETPFEMKAQGDVYILLRLHVINTGGNYLLQPTLGSLENSS